MICVEEEEKKKSVKREATTQNKKKNDSFLLIIKIIKNTKICPLHEKNVTHTQIREQAENTQIYLL